MPAKKAISSTVVVAKSATTPVISTKTPVTAVVSPQKSASADGLFYDSENPYDVFGSVPRNADSRDRQRTSESALRTESFSPYTETAEIETKPKPKSWGFCGCCGCDVDEYDVRRIDEFVKKL